MKDRDPTPIPPGFIVRRCPPRRAQGGHFAKPTSKAHGGPLKLHVVSDNYYGQKSRKARASMG